jgi:phage-related protein
MLTEFAIERNNRAGMPAVRILFYREAREAPPVLDWLERLPQKERDKARHLIGLLAGEGHELRRPCADLLRDGVYELRATHQRQQNRILYFFHGQGVAVLAHALKKEAKVSDQAIQVAIARRNRFREDPDTHTYDEEHPDAEDN